jgi:hypothetical protein
MNRSMTEPYSHPEEEQRCREYSELLRRLPYSDLIGRTEPSDFPAGILEWQYKEGILIRSSAGDPAKTQERILPLGGTLLNGAPNMLSSSQSSLLRETRECHGARSPFLPSTREPARKNRTINI